MSVPLCPEHDALGLPMRITFAAHDALKARIKARLRDASPT